MKPLAFPLLTDENIHSRVVDVLRSQGKNVLTAKEAGLGGKPDTVLLARAVQDGRVVLTHDSDFGRLTINSGEPSVGILFASRAHRS